MQDQEAHPYVVAGFAWLICFVVMLFFTLGNVSELRLLNDDYVRLVQVYDFLDGQGWNDLTQYRLAPPEGLPMHWSRLPDLPLALVIGLSESVLGRETATKIALVAVAGLYLLVLFFCTARLGMIFGATSESGTRTRRLANLTVLYAMFGLYTIVQFVPGRIDHHNLQIVLSMGVLLCVTLSLNEAAQRSRRDRMALAAGLLATLSLAIGLEALPILIAANASYGLLWALASNDDLRTRAMRAGCLFSLSSAATALIETGLLSPEGSLLSTNCDTLSGTYVALVALVAALWLLLCLAQGLLKSALGRLAGGGVLAAGAAALFATLAPHCLAGPYAEVDPLLRDLWLSNVSEAKGLADLLERPDRLAVTYSYPLLAFLSLFILQRQGRLSAPERVAPLAVFLLIAFLVSLSQIRFGSFAQAFAVFPVALLAQRLMEQAPKLTMPVARLAPTLAILALLNPLAIILPARVVSDVPEEPGIDRTTVSSCGLPGSLSALAAAPKARILGFIDIGPELLFFTPHEVLAAPYHRNTEGLLTTMRFFTAADEATARRLVAQTDADYVLFCDQLPERHLYSAKNDDSLMARLLGQDTPAWLAAAPELGSESLSVYRVVAGALAETESQPPAQLRPAILERIID